VEYALLIALIAVVLIGAVTFLGEAADDSLRGSSSSIVDATT
jgi:Flp pilus assembly pilin Flp